ncbi:hypothetical protein L7F22_001971 [Adiantum nelumboides]|nr:hypothetical protein [Adiantum nelumboides]
MERSRLPAPSKKLRHAPRNQTRRLSAVYVLSTILLLFFMLAIFHSKLSAANSSSLTRLFISPISQRAPNFTSLKLRNGTIVRKVAARKLGKRSGSRSSTQGGVKGAGIGTGIKAVTDFGIAVDSEGNADKGHHQHDSDELERDDNDAKNKHGDSMDGGNWGNEILPVRMSTQVRERMAMERVLPGSADSVSEPITKHVSTAKILPRWDPLENIGDREDIGDIARDKFSWKSSRLPAMKWDHLLGVVRQMGNGRSSSTLLQSRKARLYFEFPHFRNSHGVSFDKFGSDDEPLHQYVINNLENIANIDDALLFSVEKRRNVTLRSWSEKKLKTDAYKKERSTSKGVLDPLNPINNPLLQDPDTSSPNGLSGYDKVVLKALRKVSSKSSLEAEHGNVDMSRDTLAIDRKNKKAFEIAADSVGQLGSVAERSILELSKNAYTEMAGRQEHTDRFMNKNQSPLSELSLEKKSNSVLDTRKWGVYPGLDVNLACSDFLEQFLEDERCSHRVFMVWTTPSWTYTVRYQRGLESLLYFHPRACVVVFSVSSELDVFTSFVDQGFRVAVVVPNLEELLAGTPAEVFASFWLPWTKTHFFHIHYSELLRLAALYKYGGIYLDADVVLLKPLVLLHNMIGSEKTAIESPKLNGAVMAFDKNSSFLLECLVEFTETYDDQLLEFNGAGLVTRVFNRLASKQKKKSMDYTEDFRIEEPHTFFPLSREEITRYFKAPDSKEQQLEIDQLAESIYSHSSTLHLWNQKTLFLVPEASSLVERILNRNCIKCDDFL